MISLTSVSDSHRGSSELNLWLSMLIVHHLSLREPFRLVSYTQPNGGRQRGKIENLVLHSLLLIYHFEIIEIITANFFSILRQGRPTWPPSASGGGHFLTRAELWQRIFVFGIVHAERVIQHGCSLKLGFRVAISGRGGGRRKS